MTDPWPPAAIDPATPDPATPDLETTVSQKLDPKAFIRTYVPWVVGAILGFLTIHIPVVAQALAWINSFLLPLGVDVRTLLNGAAIFGVMALYYWVARKVGKKHPKIEALLLGSSATPTYTK